MSVLLICLVALLASGLTFFSGFGLGTLLLPAFALFYPIEQAVVMTAIVHFINGLVKLALTARHADGRAVVSFGLPAVIASFVGAWALLRLSHLAPVAEYVLAGRTFAVTPVKVIVGVLLLVFAAFEAIPRWRQLTFPPRYLPLGGILSGFFGGLAGMQGALRSAFLVRSGLSKEAFIATGVAVACLIDLTRLSTYSRLVLADANRLELNVLLPAILAACLGAVGGNHYLKKMTLRGVQTLVSALVLVVALGLIAGVL